MPFLTTALVAGGIAAAGAVGSSAIKAHAAGQAAKAQQSGAQAAQQAIIGGEKPSQQFLNQEWQQQQANEAPYLQEGATAANKLGQFLQTPFTAPTLEEARATPGYQFTLEQGADAIDQNAAATGNLMSGNTGAALERYGQGLADTTYQQDYQRALDTYMANYQTLQGGTQVGEVAAGQSGAQGANAVSENTGINLGGAEAQAQQLNNAAAARASGYVGSANAWGSGITGAAGDVSSALLLQQMMNKSSMSSLPPANQYPNYPG